MNFAKVMLTIIASIGLILALALSASAQTPSRYIPYKGMIERDGAPLTATLSITFDLWSAASGGTLLHSEARSVLVTGGNFSARIGPVPESAFTNQELYLAIELDGVPLGGRQLVQTSPYALRGQPGLPFKADSFTMPANTGADLVVRPGAAALGNRTLEVVAERLALTSGAVTAALTPTTNGGQSALDVSTRVVAHGDLVLPADDVILSTGGLVTPRLGASTPIAVNAAFPASNTLSGTFVDSGGTLLLFASGSSLCDASIPGVLAAILTLDVRVDNTSVGQVTRLCRTDEGSGVFSSLLVPLSRTTFPTGSPTTPVTRTVTLSVTSNIPIVTPDAQHGQVTVVALPTP